MKDPLVISQRFRFSVAGHPQDALDPFEKHQAEGLRHEPRDSKGSHQIHDRGILPALISAAVFLFLVKERPWKSTPSSGSGLF